MGFFQGLGRRLQGAFDPSNVASAQAALAGDYGAMARIGHDRRESRAAQEARQSQVRSLRELGYNDAEIGAMNADDASYVVRARLDPYTLSQGSRRYQPGIGGAETQVTEAPNPTEVQRNYEYLRQQDPGLAESYLAKQSLIINSGIDPSNGQPYSQAIDPRSLYNFGGQNGQPPQGQPQLPGPQSQAPPQGQGPQPPSQREIQLRQQAADAIRNGADPDQVNRRLEQMLGGAGQQGPQTFPY